MWHLLPLLIRALTPVRATRIARGVRWAFAVLAAMFLAAYVMETALLVYRQQWLNASASAVGAGACWLAATFLRPRPARTVLLSSYGRPDPIE